MHSLRVNTSTLFLLLPESYLSLPDTLPLLSFILPPSNSFSHSDIFTHRTLNSSDPTKLTPPAAALLAVLKTHSVSLCPKCAGIRNSRIEQHKTDGELSAESVGCYPIELGHDDLIHFKVSEQVRLSEDGEMQTYMTHLAKGVEWLVKMIGRTWNTPSADLSSPHNAIPEFSVVDTPPRPPHTAAPTETCEDLSEPIITMLDVILNAMRHFLHTTSHTPKQHDIFISTILSLYTSTTHDVTNTLSTLSSDTIQKMKGSPQKFATSTPVRPKSSPLHPRSSPSFIVSDSPAHPIPSPPSLTAHLQTQISFAQTLTTLLFECKQSPALLTNQRTEAFIRPFATLLDPFSCFTSSANLPRHTVYTSFVHRYQHFAKLVHGGLLVTCAIFQFLATDMSDLVAKSLHVFLYTTSLSSKQFLPRQPHTTLLLSVLLSTLSDLITSHPQFFSFIWESPCSGTIATPSLISAILFIPLSSASTIPHPPASSSLFTPKSSRVIPSNSPPSPTRLFTLSSPTKDSQHTSPDRLFATPFSVTDCNTLEWKTSYVGAVLKSLAPLFGYQQADLQKTATPHRSVVTKSLTVLLPSQATLTEAEKVTIRKAFFVARNILRKMAQLVETLSFRTCRDVLSELLQSDILGLLTNILVSFIHNMHTCAHALLLLVDYLHLAFHLSHQPKRNISLRNNAIMTESSNHQLGGGVIDDELEAIRKKRLQYLKEKQEENLRAIAAGGGRLRDIEENQFLPEVTGTKWAVVSFYHHTFNRCAILHSHLEKLAPKYPTIKFLKIDVEKCPFFVEKLKVRVLPELLYFHDGINTARSTGFEDFGNQDTFETRLIEERMAKEGMIVLGEEHFTQSKSSKKTMRAHDHSFITSTEADMDALRQQMMEDDDFDDL
ncbi:putative Thioredoxin [Blattamonas nauphoetae]|uniref:Thioredoxin n=1 Tax=Blattamonas nauphoetae TaxID=2049346 RepID=A0ABQ9YKI4_9EUKA|nr:putative Thioredoxin [Blattamonas nauphoetae]